MFFVIFPIHNDFFRNSSAPAAFHQNRITSSPGCETVPAGRRITTCGGLGRGKKIKNFSFYTPLGYIFDVNSFRINKTTPKSRRKTSQFVAWIPVSRRPQPLIEPAAALLAHMRR